MEDVFQTFWKYKDKFYMNFDERTYSNFACR